MKETKRYDLRTCPRPLHSPLLSTTVSVRNEAGEVGYCYVAFSEHLVHAVGKKLSKGLSPDNPAILSVVFMQNGVWAVYAKYVVGEEDRLLWRTCNSTRPPWLKFFKTKEQNGNPKTARKPRKPRTPEHTAGAATRSPAEPTLGSHTDACCQA